MDYDESNGVVSLLKIEGMLLELSNLVGRRVDLVEEQGLKEFMLASVDRDKILIYDQSSAVKSIYDGGCYTNDWV